MRTYNKKLLILIYIGCLLKFKVGDLDLPAFQVVRFMKKKSVKSLVEIGEYLEVPLEGQSLKNVGLLFKIVFRSIIKGRTDCLINFPIYICRRNGSLA